MEQIRMAVREDIPALLAIYNEEVLHGVATLDLTAKTLSERQAWFDAHNRDNHPLIVCEADGEIAGYASLSDYREKEAYRSTVEASVYVAKPFRRRGIGARLMERILAMAREDERTHLVVSVITSGNAASKRLHERFGFTLGGHIPEAGMKFGAYQGIDHYYLKV